MLKNLIIDLDNFSYFKHLQMIVTIQVEHLLIRAQ